MPRDFPSLSNPFPGPRSATEHRGRALHSAATLLVVVAISLALAKWAKPVLVPLALALSAHLALAPLVRGLKRIHVPPALGGLLVVLGIAFGGAFAAIQLAGPLLEWTEELPDAFASLEGRLEQLREPLQLISQASASVDNIAGEADALKVQIEDASVTSVVLEGAGQFVALSLLTLVLLYFLLASDGAFLRNLVRATPRLREKRRAVETMRRLEGDVSRYFSTVLGMSALVGFAEGLAMHSLGMPHPVVWGLAGMVLNWAPYVGAIVGTGAVALVASTAFDSTAQMIAPPLVYLAITSIEGGVLTPAVLGRRLKLNPVVVLVWVALWTWIWGLAGAFLAAPMLAALRIVSHNVDDLRPLADVLGIHGEDSLDDLSDDEATSPQSVAAADASAL